MSSFCEVIRVPLLEEEKDENARTEDELKKEDIRDSKTEDEFEKESIDIRKLTELTTNTGEYSRRKSLLALACEKKLKILNFLGYMLLCGCLALGFLLHEVNLFRLNDAHAMLPMQMYFMVGCWSVVLSVQGIFAIVPMFYEIELFQKMVNQVSYKYLVTVLAYSLYAFLFFLNKGRIEPQLLVFAVVLFAKISQLIFYVSVKYIDEGVYYVGYVEFVGLHLMNSLNNAWLSYLTFFSASYVISEIITNLNVPESRKYTVAVIFAISLLAESSISLAYYKDVFFALMIFIILMGCWFLSETLSQVLLGLALINLGLLFFTFIKHREKVVYLKPTQAIRRLERLNEVHLTKLENRSFRLPAAARIEKNS